MKTLFVVSKWYRGQYIEEAVCGDLGSAVLYIDQHCGIMASFAKHPNDRTYSIRECPYIEGLGSA